MASAAPGPIAASNRRLGIAWLLLCTSLALHVTDEALTGFLSVYNPTALEIRRLTFLRPPVFEFRVWLTGLIVATTILFALSPFAFRNARPWRPIAWIFATIMLLNGISHTVGSILGHSFRDITFPRPMPGFYSSPFLLAAAIWMFAQLRRSRS